MNREETNRYISHAGKCHFLGNNGVCCNFPSFNCFVVVDLDNDEVSDVQPHYAAHTNWTIEAKAEYLNSARSNKLFRAFYIPFISRKFTKYDQYLLLRRVSPRRISPSED